MILMLPLTLYSEDKAEKPKESGKNELNTILENYPPQMIKDDRFEIKNLTFGRVYDLHGRGEVLNVEFELKNMTDQTMEFYIIVIAAYTVEKRDKSSFLKPLSDKDKILMRSFVPFPIEPKDFNKLPREMVNENFRYEYTNEKDSKEKSWVWLRFPRDIKKGINPSTGKTYTLNENLYVKTSHLSKYRKNYYFFNEVTLLIYDAAKVKEDSGFIMPVYKQILHIKGKRR